MSAPSLEEFSEKQDVVVAEYDESEAGDDNQLELLGYKQEFKRDFKRLELFGLSFTIVGVVQSIAWVPASFALGTQLTNCDPRRAVPFCFTLYPMAV